MPTKVTRNGKTYYEYTPQELEERRLNNLIDERIASGYVWRPTESVFQQALSVNPSGIKGDVGSNRRWNSNRDENN